MKKIYLFVILFFMVTLSNAKVWYVHPDSTIAYIQEGLDSCATGDTVLVGPGEYYENLYWPNTQGILLVSELGADTTIIDGAQMDRVITLDTGVDSSSRISGFTIQYGYGTTGAGIYCDNSSPIIEYCRIINNEANGGYGGGGIGCVNHSSPLIRYCHITDNQTDATGGGVLCYDYSSPLLHADYISNNTGDPGAGVSIAYGCFPLIDSCTLINNIGDGIYCGGGDAAVNYCNIQDNTGYGLRNGDPNFTIDAENNWWGDPSGPGGVGPGTGDEVCQWVDYSPWLNEPVGGVTEKEVVFPSDIDKGATIISGPLFLPLDQHYTIYDITGRRVSAHNLEPGVYFLEVKDCRVRKIVKIR